MVSWLRFWFNDLLCACYHPPRPKYSTSEFLDLLDRYIEHNILAQDVCFILAGDLNKLNAKQLEVKHGLTQMVSSSTRGKSVLDVFYTTRPDLFYVEVFRSCVKSDHYAVGINLSIKCAEESTNGSLECVAYALVI